MNKEQQIEEMASNVENALHNHCRMFVSCNCNDCEFLKYRTPKTDCQAMCIAKNLYNENYRKIYDDCAVITKAELKQYKDQAVKEFAEKLKSGLGNCTGCYIPNCFESPTDEFAYSEKDLLKLIDNLLKE